MNVATITEWVNKTFHGERGPRDYRFEGEQSNHAQQLAETQAAIAGFEAVAANPDATPEERHWLNAHRVGMEDRLAVFEGRPRLTLEELNERDAIETHLYGAPLPRGRATPPPTEPKRFLSPLAASPALAILASPWTWLVAALAFCGIQMVLKERIEDQRDQARADLAQMETSRDAYARQLGEERARHATEVAQVLEDTATTVEQMRVQAARRAAREARERSRREDLARGNVNFTERLRELAQPDSGLPTDPAAAPGGGPAGAVSTEPRPDADDGAHP